MPDPRRSCNLPRRGTRTPAPAAVVAALLLAALLLSCGGERKEPAPGATKSGSDWMDVPKADRPFNLILITLDTTRRDRLSCYGVMPDVTPNLDRFAAGSVLFENAQTPVPITLAAHSSMLTGLWPFEHGVRNNGTYVLPESLTTLAELLRGRGYETGAVLGAFPLAAGFGTNQGFDHYDDHFSDVSREHEEETARRTGDEVTRLALEWLDGRGEKPFFLWAHYYDAHHPYHQAPAFAARWPKDPYTASVATMDQAVGRLLDEAQRRGRLERTVVIIAGDHGEGLGDHVEQTHTVFIYGETQHVPLLIRFPEQAPFAGPEWRGRCVAPLVSLVDLLPTAWNALGLPRTDLPRMPGRTLLPVIPGGGEVHPFVYHESLLPLLEKWATDLRGLQTEPWKYIRAPRPELYNLEKDPGERENLADREKSRVREMETNLAELLAGETTTRGSTPDRETVERLRSLGYLAGGLGTDGPAPTADPKDMIWVPMTVTRAQDLAAVSRVTEALAAVDSVLARHPETSLARQLRALYLTRLGRAPEAVAAYQKALTEVTDGPDRIKLMQGYVYALLGTGRKDDALRQARALVDANPREPWLHLLLGEALLATGDYAGARTALLEERRRLPSDAQPLVTLANVEKAAGRPTEAEQALREAARLRPDDPDVQVQLAALLLETRRLDEGTALLDRVLAAHPTHPDANFQRAEALRRAGRHADAARYYQAALQARPGDPMLLHRLGNSYLELNRLTEAETCFQTAVRAGQATQGILASLGIAYARQKKPADAIRSWQEAIRLGPQSPMVPMLQRQISEAQKTSRN